MCRWHMRRGNRTQSGSSSQSDRSNEEGGARKEGIEENNEDEGTYSAMVISTMQLEQMEDGRLVKKAYIEEIAWKS